MQMNKCQQILYISYVSLHNRVGLRWNGYNTISNEPLRTHIICPISIKYTVNSGWWQLLERIYLQLNMTTVHIQHVSSVYLAMLAPASLRARWTLNGIKLFAVHCLRVPYMTHKNLLPLLVKGKPFMTLHFSRVSKFVQTFVRSNNTSVVFYRSTGRNETRCQNSACLEIDDTDLLTKSHCIRELLDVRDGVIDIPSLDIDEVLTTINEIICNWLSLCIICYIFYDLKSYHCHYRILMHIILRHFINHMCGFFLFILHSYLNCTCLFANKYYIYNHIHGLSCGTTFSNY